MRSAVSETLAFFRENPFSTILSRIRAREVPPLLQFFVYGVCGALSTIVFVGIVATLNYTLLPAHPGMRVTTHPLVVLGHAVIWPADSAPDHSQIIAAGAAGDEIRSWNYFINNCIGFLFANIVAYVTNILFVFKTGRHHPVLEFLYFTLVSGISFAVSQVAGPWLIHRFGIDTNVAMLTNLVASVLLNFVARKFFVFKN